MATYNGEKYIEEQIRSILSQLEAADELVISDNGSTDQTLRIIAAFNDRRIRLYTYQVQQNLIFNFENALLQARGDCIFLSDQDDVWLPGRIAECLPLLEKYDLVVSDCAIVDGHRTIREASFFQKNQSGPGLVKNGIRNTYIGCCMCFSRRLLSAALPFPRQIPMHDIWIGFVADLFFRSFFYRKVLVDYRRHEQNASSFGKSESNFFKQLMYRFNTFRYLPLLLRRKYKKAV